MPSFLKLKNNTAGLLVSNITSLQTFLTLIPDQGALFPTIGANEFFFLTMVRTDGTFEIAKVTARSGDIFTIIRGQEGTVGLSFNAGDRVELRMTALAFDYFIEITSPTGAAKFPVGSTAERPTGESGFIRINSSTNTPEWYDTSLSSWVSL